MMTHYVVMEIDESGNFEGTIYYTKAYAERIAKQEGGRLALLTILEGDD